MARRGPVISGSLPTPNDSLRRDARWSCSTTATSAPAPDNRDRPPRLTLRIPDDGTAPPATDGWGQGIEGMRERARALASSLTAGPHPDGGFEVCAELPVPEDR